MKRGAEGAEGASGHFMFYVCAKNNEQCCVTITRHMYTYTGTKCRLEGT